MSSRPLLQITDLKVSAISDGRRVDIVRGVNLEVERGQAIALIGESGSGKSMTARCITKLLPRDFTIGGKVIFDGIDVLALQSRALRELRARRVALITQDPRAGIDPLQTCGDALVEVIHTNLSLSRREAIRQATELLSEVGITDTDRVMSCYPHQLSGGMLQRILIAGAIATGPDLLIADEPTTALDVTTQAEIIELFKKLMTTKRLAVIFISHDLDVAAALCSRVAVMYAGRLVEVSDTSTLFAAPRHPYTAGLLAARPKLHSSQRRLDAIPGRPPTTAEITAGCAFAPRCGFTTARCQQQVPPLTTPGRAKGASNEVACWHCDELDVVEELTARGRGRG